jgi:glycogen operon protein
LWTEWNGKYRDAMRAFWKGDDRGVAELATRIAGSNDLYERSGRLPYASINFITAHDGFTLHDLVSYNDKHNDANPHNNEDGESNNLSWNCGAEGPTNHPEILALRGQQKRNLMASLLLSVGVPMISGGDEMCRTQQGNNNAYCQDNELSWTHWDLDAEQREFLEFTRRLVAFRKHEPVMTRRKYFQGRSIRGAGVKDIYWLDPSGREMTDETWNAPSVRSLGVLMVGNAIDEVDERGRQVTGDTVLVLLNAHDRDVPFVLPKTEEGKSWLRAIDTICATTPEERWNGETQYPLRGRTMALFTLNGDRRERRVSEPPKTA